jgi:transposase
MGSEEAQKNGGPAAGGLLHDNAPAHRSVLVEDFLAKNNVTSLKHPPYSPDQTAADFTFFSRINQH